MKMKTKLTLFSVILMCFFLGSFSTKATSSIDSLTCPATVKFGETFVVSVGLSYPANDDCLYATNIWLYHGVGVPILDYRHCIIMPVDSLADFPKPTSVSITVNSSFIGKVNDTIAFMLKIKRGKIVDGVITKVGEIFFGDCYITIEKARGINFSSNASIILPVLVLSAVILVRKKKIKN